MLTYLNALKLKCYYYLQIWFEKKQKGDDMGIIEENHQEGQQKKFDGSTKVLGNFTRFSSVN